MPKQSQQEKPVPPKRKYVEGHDMSLEEVAQVFGIHRNSVHDTEKRALRKFKAGVEARGYKLEDFFR
jgi:DNA-directed RNA polymerase sigma subunit (sigma70/sigma32)